MPGLVFRKRRLLLGGDEFMLPYASVAFGRTVWVICLSVTLVITGTYMLSAKCAEAGFAAFAYEVISICVGVLSIVVELRIAVVSTYGTIIDPGPRAAPLTRGLWCKSILAVVQLVLGLIGVFLLFYVPINTDCGSDSFTTMATIMAGLIATVISQLLDAGGMYCCFLSFTSSESDWHDEAVEAHHGVLAEMERRYEELCRTACMWLACCACAFNVFGGGAEETDFTYVSRVFGRLLSARHFMDVVATDIAAGLILLRHVQKTEDYKRRAELLGTAAPTSTITEDPGKESSLADETDRPTAPASPAAVRSELGSKKGMVEREAPCSGDTAGGAGTPRDIFRAESLVAASSPGSVPMEDRPKMHRKYYKVTKDERPVNLQYGEDRRLLEELGHYVKYADVMYSVWGTLIADPWSGMSRFIRRRGWCPMFLKRRVTRRRFGSASSGSTASNLRVRSRTLSRSALRDRAASPLSSVLSDGGGGGRDSGRISVRRSSAASTLRESLYASTYNYKAEIRGDSIWGTHETALRTELPDGAELVLAHFNNCLDETPYCVAVDHVWQSVVITIRGTHSFEDFLVDAMAEPRSLEAVGREWGFDGTGMEAHDGILRRTEWIRRDLEESGVLRMLLGETRREPWSIGGGRSNRAGGEQKDDEGRVPLAAAAGGTFCAGYTVRVVGHSLGAGCAALLTLLLKPAYPCVRGIAVSPPGGLVSEGACREATEAVVTSLVLNDDVIPRMSWRSIERLADQVLDVLGRSRVSKLFVMRSLLRADEDAHCPDLYLAPEGSPPQPQQQQQQQQQQEEARKAQQATFSSTATTTPGSIEDDPDDDPRPSGLFHGNARVVPEDEEAGMPADEVGVSESGFTRFHRQLRRYREHLKEEVPLRRHLNQLRPPGRILHLVNTEIVTTREDNDETPNVDDDAVGTGCCISCCTGSSRYSRGPIADYSHRNDSPCCGCTERGDPNSCSDSCGRCWCFMRSRAPEDELEVSGAGYSEMRGDGSRGRGYTERSGRWKRDETRQRKKMTRRRIFTPVWASPDDLAEIRVTPAFLVDHNPEEILPAMEQTLEDLGVFV